jgi:hypothetical protein
VGYDLFEHRHRFAVWAAARGSQRGFAKVEDLRNALESSDIVDFLRRGGAHGIDATAFEVHHRRWCAAIVQKLHEIGIPNVSYGRAAKLVALYLKAMVVVGPDSGSDLARVAHPPVDRILLHNLASSSVDSPHKLQWRNTTWTTLDESGYYALVSKLKGALKPNDPLWMLEQYWTVTDSPY